MKRQNKTSDVLKKLSYLSDIFDRWMEGGSSDSEKKIIEEWNIEKQMNEYPDKEEPEKKRLKRYAKVTHSIFSTIGFDEESIQQQIRTEIERSKSHKLRKNFYIRQIAAAACVLVLFTIGGLLYYQSDNTNGIFFSQTAVPDSTIITPFTEIRSVILNDGTKITMNGGSTISFAGNRFNKSKREIWLEGEAFFEVAKNPAKPFIVHHGDLQTIVKGTSFNIKSYAGLPDNVVSVSTGKVEIKQGREQIGMFAANEELVYDTQSAKYEKTRSASGNAAAWMQKRMVLKNASVEEFAIRLKQLYGVELSVDGNSFERRKIGAVFAAGTDLNEIIKNVCSLYGLDYKTTSADKITIFEK